MTARLSTIISELKTLIAANTFYDSAKYTWVNGRLNIAQTGSNAANRRFSIIFTAIPEQAADYGINAQTSIWSRFEITLCRKAIPKNIDLETILTSDAEELLVLLTRNANKGSAVLIQFESMNREASNEFVLLRFYFKVRTDLLMTI